MQSRGWTFLFWPIAAKDDKAEGKQAEDKGVFLWFRDDLAVDGDLYGASAVRRKIGMQGSHSPSMIESSRKEVANGFVDNASTRPSRRRSAGIGQSASGDTNSHVVRNAVIVKKEIGNGSVAAADGDGGGVGGAGGKSDVGSATARNSGSHRSNVVGVGTGKQRRKLKVGIAGLVGVENVARAGRHKLPSVALIVV